MENRRCPEIFNELWRNRRRGEGECRNPPDTSEEPISAEETSPTGLSCCLCVADCCAFTDEPPGFARKSQRRAQSARGVLNSVADRCVEFTWATVTAARTRRAARGDDAL